MSLKEKETIISKEVIGTVSHKLWDLQVVVNQPEVLLHPNGKQPEYPALLC